MSRKFLYSPALGIIMILLFFTAVFFTITLYMAKKSGTEKALTGKGGSAGETFPVREEDRPCLEVLQGIAEKAGLDRRSIRKIVTGSSSSYILCEEDMLSHDFESYAEYFRLLSEQALAWGIESATLSNNTGQPVFGNLRVGAYQNIDVEDPLEENIGHKMETSRSETEAAARAVHEIDSLAKDNQVTITHLEISGKGGEIIATSLNKEHATKFTRALLDSEEFGYRMVRWEHPRFGSFDTSYHFETKIISPEEKGKIDFNFDPH